MLSASYAGGIIGPLVATMADRIGRKTGMLVGLTIFTIGSVLMVIFPNIFIFFVAILLGTFGRNIVIPAMVAYIGDQVPFESRGKAIGIVETSWSLAFILFIPLVGLLMEKFGWQTPFIFLAVSGLIMLASVQIVIPPDNIPRHAYRQNPFAYLKLVLANRYAVYGLVMGVFIFTGSASIQIIYGVWLQDAFKLSITALGLASTVIGFAQLAGELLSAALVDRIGKKKSVYIGLVITIFVSAMIFWLDDTLPGSLVWLFIFFIGLEYAVISSLSMMSEIVPEACASVIAIFYATVSIGFTVGPAVAPLLYRHGFSVNTLSCIFLFGCGLFFLSKIRMPKNAVRDKLPA